jgi:hypothetical protein
MEYPAWNGLKRNDKLRINNLAGFYHKPIYKYKIFRYNSDLLRERLLSRLCLDLLRLFSLLLLLLLADLLLLLPFSELADLLLLLSLLTLADRLRSPIFRLQSQRLKSIFEFLKMLLIANARLLKARHAPQSIPRR